MGKNEQGFLLFGHRGAAGEAPENTIGGFVHALESGVRAFELDVHLTKDKQLVVIHDGNLERTTDGVGLISDFSVRELSLLNAAYRFPKWKKREEIPTLDNVLKRFSNAIDYWQLEIKQDVTEHLDVVCQLLPEFIDRYNLRNRVTVTSFEPEALRIQHKQAPYLRLGLIREPMKLEDIELAQKIGCSEVCISVKNDNEHLVSAAHKANLLVTGWLGNKPSELNTLLEWEVDFITSDFPSFAIQFLKDKKPAFGL